MKGTLLLGLIIGLIRLCPASAADETLRLARFDLDADAAHRRRSRL